MKNKVKKKAKFWAEDYVDECGGITLYHGTSAERALSIILKSNQLVEPSVGFYLDALLDSSNPRVNELYEDIKKWSLEKFVNVHKESPFFFTPDLKKSTQYAMLTKAPVVLSIYLDSLTDATKDGWTISGCDIVAEYLFAEDITCVTEEDEFDEVDVSADVRKKISFNGRAVLSLIPVNL